MRRHWPIWTLAVLLAAIVGTALGFGLGYLDLLFLSGRVSFAQTADYLTFGQLFVRYLPVAVNAVYGSLLGTLVGALLLCRRPGGGNRFSRAITGGLIGGILGAVSGYLNIAVLSQYLNLASSDNVAAWREYRSFLVMINAGVGGVFGFATGLVVRGDR